ncbi:unnamed protein product [Lota lota]
MQEGRGKKLLLDGFKVKNARVMAKEARSNEMERRREEEQQAATEPASGSEDMFESGEEQRQQDEDNDYADATLQEGDGDAGVASRGQTIPSTIGSSMDGVSCKVGCSTEGTPEESAMGHYARECIPESIERVNISITEEGDVVDSEEEESEESDEDVMQTEGDPEDELEKEEDTLVNQSQGQGVLIDITLGSTLDDVWPEWSASGEGTSGEQASQVTKQADEAFSTGSLGDKQRGDEEGDGEESESWITDMLLDNVSEKERDKRPQMERKAEEATKKRKAALQAEAKKKKKDQRRIK